MSTTTSRNVFSTPSFAQLSATILATALSCATSRAQCETFGPLTPGVRTSQSFDYSQIWSQIARTSTGYTAVWSEGQDILLRRLDSNLNGISGDTLVNATLNVNQQDEPAIAVATGGNQLIAWSERYGYDGEQMGIYGRVFNATGTPLGAEFRVNQIWAASQWRPLIAPTPAGGFVVTWTGDWDGNSYFRVLDAAGGFLTNDIRVNQYTNDAQVDPSVAVAPNGTIFAAFVDFSSHSGVGTYLNLYGRLFNALGAPLGDEFQIPAVYNVGDQRLPWVAVDGSNRFVVAWESESVDGSGYAIVARRYDATGNALGTEFQVNTTTNGQQIEPRVACEADGDFLVTWEDYSLGYSRPMCRRFDAAAQPKGPEFLVADTSAPAYRPEVVVSPTGADIVIAYELDNGWDIDVYARRFSESASPQVFGTGKLNAAGCTPQIAFSGAPSASSNAPFTISATNVTNQKAGLLFYGFASTFTPFQGGTLYVAGPRRTQIQFSNGSASGLNCTGAFSYDFNARIGSGIDPQLVAGRTVTAQYYYRDPQASFAIGLTNAVRFTICP